MHGAQLRAGGNRRRVIQVNSTFLLARSKRPLNQLIELSIFLLSFGILNYQCSSLVSAPSISQPVEFVNLKLGCLYLIGDRITSEYTVKAVIASLLATINKSINIPSIDYRMILFTISQYLGTRYWSNLIYM